MAPSRRCDLHSSFCRSARVPGAGLWPSMAVVLLAGAFGLAAVLGGAPSRVQADTQPALAVSVKSGTSTQTTYVVTATGFPASTPFTETYGDGSAIPPTSGTTSASGSFTLWWTLDTGSKYCGTITASAGSAQASASFWVAEVSDAASGTTCAGQGASGTPTVQPTAAATATATAQATATQAAAPTAVPTGGTAGSGDGGSTGLTALLKRVPWLWVGGGAIALVLLLIIIAALAAGKRTPSKDARPPTRGMPAPGRWQGRGQNGPWGAEPGRRQPPPRPGAPRRGPPTEDQSPMYQPPMYQPEERSGSSNHPPGSGRVDPRWRVMDRDAPRRRPPAPPAPDPRWSRSQPGRQSGGRGRYGS